VCSIIVWRWKRNEKRGEETEAKRRRLGMILLADRHASSQALDPVGPSETEAEAEAETCGVCSDKVSEAVHGVWRILYVKLVISEPYSTLPTITEC